MWSSNVVVKCGCQMWSSNAVMHLKILYKFSDFFYFAVLYRFTVKVCLTVKNLLFDCVLLFRNMEKIKGEVLHAGFYFLARALRHGMTA